MLKSRSKMRQLKGKKSKQFSELSKASLELEGSSKSGQPDLVIARSLCISCVKMKEAQRILNQKPENAPLGTLHTAVIGIPQWQLLK